MNFISEWGNIAGFAGLVLGAFLYLIKGILNEKLISKFTRKQAFYIYMAFMILVWSFSLFSLILYYVIKSDIPSQVTVLVHGEKGKDELVLPNRGKVKLTYGDANVVETINDKGEATFKQVPSEFFGSEATVEILFFDPEGEPYRVINPDSLYQLTKGKYISLIVKLYGLSQLRGIVKDFETGDPISGVRVGIAGVETFSNQYGEYTLTIPAEFQRKFQTVRAFKDGYELYELKNVPIQTENEHPILMKPKHNN